MDDQHKWVIHKRSRRGSSRPKILKMRYSERCCQTPISTTNNEVEYEALITGLKLAKMLMARRIVLQADSQLIVEQVKGVYEAREDRMKKYMDLVQQLQSSFDKAIF